MLTPSLQFIPPNHKPGVLILDLGGNPESQKALLGVAAAGSRATAI